MQMTSNKGGTRKGDIFGLLEAGVSIPTRKVTKLRRGMNREMHKHKIESMKISSNKLHL